MDFLRQLDLVRPEALEAPVAVVGCGGIGSFAALALAKMGCAHLTLYDDDRVEGHNIPNQLYRPGDVGRPKAEALAEIVRAFTGTTPRAALERVEGQRLEGLVVAGVDSMRARRSLWQRSVRYRAAVPLFLDGRIGAEVIRLYAIRLGVVVQGGGGRPHRQPGETVRGGRAAAPRDPLRPENPHPGGPLKGRPTKEVQA